MLPVERAIFASRLIKEIIMKAKVAKLFMAILLVAAASGCATTSGGSTEPYGFPESYAQ